RTEHFDYLRATSFRLDPCVDGLDPHAPACVRAIRLVLQPIWPIDGSDAFDIYDASLHLFYTLDDVAWATLLDRYGTIRTTDLSAAPLSVHPVLASAGLDSPFGQALRGLIAETATLARLTRMTFMATGRSGNNWFWGGFEREPGNAWR